jgi:hypothetical protein
MVDDELQIDSEDSEDTQTFTAPSPSKGKKTIFEHLGIKTKPNDASLINNYFDRQSKAKTVLEKIVEQGSPGLLEDMAPKARKESLSGLPMPEDKDTPLGRMLRQARLKEVEDSTPNIQRERIPIVEQGAALLQPPKVESSDMDERIARAESRKAAAESIGTITQGYTPEQRSDMLAEEELSRPGSFLTGLMRKSIGGSEVGRTIMGTLTEASNIFNIRDESVLSKERDAGASSELGQDVQSILGGAGRAVMELGLTGGILSKIAKPTPELLFGGQAAMNEIKPVAEGQHSIPQALGHIAVGVGLGKAAPALGRTITSETASRAENIAARVVGGTVLGGAQTLAGGVVEGQLPTPEQVKESALSIGAFEGLGARKETKLTRPTDVMRKRMLEAIIGQESGGAYDAVNVSKSTSRNRDQVALGKSQIMDFNINEWSRKYLGYDYYPGLTEAKMAKNAKNPEVAYEKFLNDKKVQDLLTEKRVSEYFDENVKKFGNLTKAIKETALDWYGRGKPSEGPSPKDYANQVFGRFKKAKGDYEFAESPERVDRGPNDFPLLPKSEGVELAELPARIGDELNLGGGRKATVVDADRIGNIQLETGEFINASDLTSGNIRNITSKRAEVDAGAQEAATSPTNDLAEPSNLQTQSGNYKKGHVEVAGFDITIENPRGSVRKGTDATGASWETELQDHYGYIKRTTGADGDHVDTFIGPDPTSDKVFVVDQLSGREGKPFDEHKVVLGANTVEEAIDIYRRNYSDNATERIGAVTETNAADFKTWVKDGDTKKPFSEWGSKQEAVVEETPIIDTPKPKKKQPTPPVVEEVKMPEYQIESEPAEQVIIPRSEFSPSSIGIETTVEVSGKGQLPAKYALVEADQLVASHNERTFSPNPDYPTETQTRDYQNTGAEKAKVIGNADNFKPRYILSDDPSPVNGPPMVDANGVVAGGNGRTMTIKRVYADNPRSAAEFKELMVSKAEQFGISADAVRSMEKPVLVRMLDGVDLRNPRSARIVDDLNDVPTQQVDPITQGIATGRRLNTSDVSEISSVLSEGNTIRDALSTKAANDRVIAVLRRSGTITKVNAPKFINDSGVLSPDGVRLVEGAMMGRVLDDVTVAKKLTALGGNYSRKITDALHGLAVAEGGGENWSMRKPLDNVLRYIADRGEVPQATYDQQIALLDNVKIPLTEFERGILAALDDSRVRTFKTFVDNYSSRIGGDLMNPDITPDAAQKETVSEFAVKLSKPSSNIQGSKESGDIEPIRNSVKTLPIASKRDIVAKLSKGLDVPTRFGRVSSSQYGGEYLPDSKLIRLRGSQNLLTMTHEVGHHLDKAFDLSTNASGDVRKELMHLGDNNREDSHSSWTSSKGTKYRIGEGIAEFFRYYMTDPDKAIDLAPKFQGIVDGILHKNPEIGDVIRSAAMDIRRWREAPAEARVNSQISIGPDNNSVPLVEKMKRGISKATTELIDDLHIISTLRDEVNLNRKAEGKSNLPPSQDPYVLARLFRGVDSVARVFVEKGAVDFNSRTVSGKGLSQILEPVRNRLDEFRLYIVSKRANELHSFGKETGFDKGDVKEVAEKYKSPEFDAVFDELKQWQDSILKYAVDGNALPAEQMQTMKAMWNDYVPFHRVFEVGVGETPQTGGGSGRGLNDVTKPSSLKKLKGSDRMLIDPLESMIKNAYTIISMTEKNVVNRAIADMSREQGMGKWIEKVNPPMAHETLSVDKVRKQLEEVGADMTNVKDGAEVEFFKRAMFLPPENMIRVKDAFGDQYYRVDPELYRSLKGLDAETPSQLTRLMSYPAQLLRAGVTLDPAFAAANLIKDSFVAGVVSKYNFIPIVDSIRGLSTMIFKKDVANEFLASMGANTFDGVYLNRDKMQSYMKEQLGDKSSMKVWTEAPLKLAHLLAETSERMTRLGYYDKVFQKAKSQGMSDRDARLLAGFESRDLLDFSMGGARTKSLKRIAAFFGAGVQGTYKVYRSFKENPIATSTKAFSYITVPTIMLYLLNRDDPEYWERPQWERDQFWHVWKMPNGKWITIPKPHAEGFFFGTLAHRFLQWADANDPKAFDGLAKDMLGHTLPAPTANALVPLAEVMAGPGGWDWYRNKSIVPKGMEYLPSEMQFTEQNSLLSREIGRMLGVSPAKVDHLINRTTGGLGKITVHQGIDRVIESFTDEERTAKGTVPFSRFVTKDGQSESVTRFYDKLYKLRQDKERLAKGERLDLDTRRELLKLNSMEAAAKDISALRKKLQETTDEERQNLLHKKMIRSVRPYIPDLTPE